MGLDMYACSVDQENHPVKPDQELPESTYCWRKHAKLHQFMNDYYNQLVEDGTIIEDENANDDRPFGTFNCVPLHLPIDILRELQELIKDEELPESDGGFFWGHQFQEESVKDYKEQDLNFCKWAINETNNGNYIYYNCWF